MTNNSSFDIFSGLSVLNKLQGLWMSKEQEVSQNFHFSA